MAGQLGCAYPGHFVGGTFDPVCQMAKSQKRVTAKERDSGNDKFTMRLFLIRLGFIGDEYKTARKILLRNLTGNSSWKTGHPPERMIAENPAPLLISQTEADDLEVPLNDKRV